VSDACDGPDVSTPPQGRYANFFRVGHNAFELLIDFGQLYAGSGHAQLHTRIVTSPAYAKALSRTLRRSLDDYEDTHGSILIDDEE
jgi:hypothetical protein